MGHKFTDYKPVSVDEETQLLAQCSPRGLVWDAKGDKDSNLYKLLKSIATEINALDQEIYTMVTEWNINNTTDLINEWETAVGIPDECRSKAEDIATRRSDVITKLRKIPIVTIQDYKDLAEIITGEPAADWNIRPGQDDVPADPLYKFVLMVTAPVQNAAAFNYPLGSGTLSATLNRAGSTVTATVADTTKMVDGSIVTIAGANESDFNGDHTITGIPTGTTFTYEAAGVAGAATGTITAVVGMSQAQIDALAGNTQFLCTPAVAFSGLPFAGQFRTDILRCVFRKVTPAHVALVFD